MREAAPSGQRSYWRSTVNGEKGYLVQRDGREYIRIDQPGDTVERNFRPSDWIPEVEHRPLSPMSMARVAWAADQELCVGLGIHAAKAWINTPESARIRFMEQGPDGTARRAVYDAIMGALRELNAAR